MGWLSYKHRATGLHDSKVWGSNTGSADKGPLSWAEEFSSWSSDFRNSNVMTDSGSDAFLKVKCGSRTFYKECVDKKWIDIRSDQWCILTNHLLTNNSNTYCWLSTSPAGTYYIRSLLFIIYFNPHLNPQDVSYNTLIEKAW